ncbi:unnamed protein product, partial [marine sediment metagenome]
VSPPKVHANNAAKTGSSENIRETLMGNVNF